MTMNPSTRERPLAGLAGAAALAASLVLVPLACQSNRAETDDVPPAPQTLGRWTEEFVRPGLVVAADVRIEGPPALRAHLALPQDLATLDSETHATDDGLLQTFTLRRDDGTTIRCQLDNWELVATRRLVVLERPFECDVRIVARGDAAWLPTEKGDERPSRRAAELDFAGELVR